MYRAMIAIVLILTGCSAGKASYALLQADRAIRNAREGGADEQAQFEYTMAQAYLVKAREEAQFSSYRDSVILSRGAADWADKALIAMEQEGREGSASAAEQRDPTEAAPASPAPPADPKPEPGPPTAAPEPAVPEPEPSVPAPEPADPQPADPEPEPTEAKPKLIIVPVPAPTDEGNTPEPQP
ncbi:MAG: hypothetical protein AB8H79_15615 [Myxococcota bacterium]